MKTLKLMVAILLFAIENLQGQVSSNKTIVKDIDGNVYKTATIGTQVWMAENLRVTKYRDGTPIPLVSDSIAWAKLNGGAYCNYKNDVKNADIYGKLYNYYTVVNQQNLCPEGWHVPTDMEWKVIVDYLGGEDIAGGKMKETGNTHWVKFGNGAATNTLASLHCRVVPVK